MVNEWSKQNELKRHGVPNINAVILIAENIPDLRTRSLFLVTYLTASRIGEIVRYKRTNSKGQLNAYSGIKKKDITFTERRGRRVILIDIRNEKHRKRFRKEIPVPLDREENIYLWKMVKQYLDLLNLDDELFPFGYSYAYRLLSKYCNPHWIRHIRLTHLITMYDFNENLLQKYAGWSDTRPSKFYAELSWNDILDKL